MINLNEVWVIYHTQTKALMLRSPYQTCRCTIV